MQTLNSVYHSHPPSIVHSRTSSIVQQNEDSHSNIYTEPTLVNNVCLPTSNNIENDSTMANISGPSRANHHIDKIHNSLSVSNETSRLEFVSRTPFVPSSSQEVVIPLHNNNNNNNNNSNNNNNNNEQHQNQFSVMSNLPVASEHVPNHSQIQIISQNNPNNASIENSNESYQMNIPVEIYPTIGIVPEFLPLCDLLFNIISLAGYFCDIVFDGIIAYTLFLNKQIFFMSLVVFLILFSGGISQILSYKWHKRDRKIQQHLANRQQLACDYDGPIISGSISTSIKFMHIFYCGVLWRYFKLFTPVDISFIKREVRDLCVLRMVHAFCEAAPMLLLQLFLLWRKPSPESITDLNMISIFLSAFSLCWALASFSKNIRTKAIDKLVLTWLGVIFQFLWRLGTITSRVVALTIYQHVYGAWIFAVLILHWFTMLLWLLSPQLVLYFENVPGQLKQLKKKKTFIQIAGTAWVYCFCFINMENEPPRHRMIAFYVTMFLENVLLMTLSVYFDHRPYKIWYRNWVISLVLGGFAFGLFFLWIYYRFFHIRHLSGYDEEQIVSENENIHFQNGQIDVQCQTPSRNSRQNQIILSMINKDKLANKMEDNSVNMLVPASSIHSNIRQQPFQQGVFEQNILNAHNTCAGVFNCRLNPALKRKKKKPSTVPPPPQTNQSLATIEEATLFEPRSRRRKSTLPNSPMYYNTAANSVFVTKQLCHSGTDTFWRKSALSSRSMSTSPATAGIQIEPTMLPITQGDVFRLPSKHPFSSSITSPKPMNDDLNHLENDSKLVRPKPMMFVDQSIDLDAIGSMLQNQMQTSRSHTFEYVSPEDEDSFTKQGARPPVPGKEGDNQANENENKSISISPENALSRARLEKLLENKRNLEQFEIESYRSHQTFSNETHRSRTTNRSKKYSSGMLRKKRAHGSSLRIHIRRKRDSYGSSNSNQSSNHSDRSSSGEEGDIESDNALTSSQHRFQAINKCLSNVNTVEDTEDGVDPVILRAKDLIAQTDNSNQRIINYHAVSNQNGKINNRQLRNMYSAKYKRHHTPL